MQQATRKRIEDEWSEATDFSKGAQDVQCDNVGDNNDSVFLRTYANGMKVEVEEI